ncbi:unnamed protein product, partial [Thlaspi arvense]
FDNYKGKSSFSAREVLDELIVVVQMAGLRVLVSSSSSSSSSSLSPPAMPIPGEAWMIGEDRVLEILDAIQPVYISDRSRNEIIKYLQNLVKDRLGVEVFFFGSVPLKTYLPDGDIDLTILTPHEMEDDLATALRSVLEAEVGVSSDFSVTNVQYIPAQVKIIKCNVRNISVDISFNQMAGLSALCFLEHVDHIFGRDHLFKRSIVLIKAWCYYESRILGANTGLISTYALAILVLHIMNISKSSVSGPLAVLFKFLEYYASFDWNNYCVTVHGQVPISSLPDITGKDAETRRHFSLLFPLNGNFTFFLLSHVILPGTGDQEVVLNEKKPATHKARFYTWSSTAETHSYTTWRNHGLETGERNGKGQRLDVEEPVVAFGTGRSELSKLRGDYERYFKCLIYAKCFHGEAQLWIPQGKDSKHWDIVRWFMATQKNVCYWTTMNGSTCVQNVRKSRGTGTYIPEMSQQSYTDRFSSKPSTSNSSPSTSQAQPSKKNP